MSRCRQRGRASFLGTLLLPLLVPTVSSAQPVAIEHESVACLVVEQFPVVDACFRPGPRLARARVYFRPEGVPNWYYVESRPAPPRVSDPPDAASIRTPVSAGIPGREETPRWTTWSASESVSRSQRNFTSPPPACLRKGIP